MTSWDYHFSEAWAPAWSPDGSEVAFESSRDSNGVLSPGIYISNVRTGLTRKVYDEQYFTSIVDMSWNPSGRWLLVSRGRWLYVFDLQTRTMRYLNGTNELMMGGAWNRTGDSIFYSREASTADGFYITSTAGGVGRRLYEPVHPLQYPIGPVDVSPDGNWITFATGALEPDGAIRNGGEIFVIRSDGSGMRQLTNLRGFNAHPRWIDGGQAILFDHYPEECYEVFNVPGHSWIVQPDGKAAYQCAADVGDRRVQFGFPPAIDRTGARAAAIALDDSTGYGVVWVMDSHGRNRRILYSPKR